jgi:methylthioribulose 1-phosphate dehydratase/enolase-phosphatase E1
MCESEAALPAKAPQAIVLDIEGCTTPITFVTDTLFPYAKANVRAYLEAGWSTAEVQGDVRALVAQSEADLAEGVEGVIAIPASSTADAYPEGLLGAVVANVEWQMELNRKTGALKQVQGHVWRAGYADGSLKGELYADVLPALKRWVGQGKKVYVYSSGSREAQRLLFQNTTDGDVRPHLSALFDTTVGSKKDAASYTNILHSLGLDDAANMLFLTDALAEAQAATAAGVTAVLTDRPGNAPISPGHGFAVVKSFGQVY